ncbi:LacI family transcriptional regulator [Acidobacteria bacterium AH-259-O06]|nr:LacI family transcriptional regulator [Acidobacteria bacterium AH-259-O06]
MARRRGGGNRPVRMKDVAKDLNVSVVTVSKVLRKHPDISPATRKRVLKRIKELDYQPNWIARSLVTRRTYIIGLVVPDLMHSFFAEIAKAIAQKVRPKGYIVVIANSDEDPKSERQEIELLLARRVDGMIVASAQPPGQTGIFKRIRGREMPFVLIDRLFPTLDVSYVGVSDEAIGEMATEHLIERGCQWIAHIRGHQITTGIGRLKGYRSALERHALKVPDRYVVKGGYGDTTGYDTMKKLLRVKPRPDGVVCYNDPVAAGAIKAIVEAGLDIPSDIAVIGAGNVRYSDLLRIPLSTVDQSSGLIGEQSAELLLELIESKRRPCPQKILLSPKLIVRDSSKRDGF